MRKKTVIAIDGPSASGKGTVARIVAHKLGIKYLDTGSIYRAFALFALEKGVKPEDGEKTAALLTEAQIFSGETKENRYKVILNGRDVSDRIRTPEVSEAASRFSEMEKVRKTLGRIQRVCGENSSIVAEGRDMGTNIFRDADYKFFLTAEPEERARRRNLQTGKSGGETAVEITERDLRDSQRKLSPLKPADDAVIIDTTHLCADEVVEKILNCVEGWKPS